MSRDEVRNDGTGDETSDARRARRRDEKRGKDFAVKIANFTRPFLDSESGAKMGVTHLCLPSRSLNSPQAPENSLWLEIGGSSLS